MLSSSTGSSNASATHPSPYGASPVTDGHPCPTCGQVLSRQGDLKRHIAQLHPTGGEKLWKCQFCPYTHVQKSNVQIHAEKHEFRRTGERPYVCPEPGCAAAYQDPGVLIRHRKKKHGYQPKHSARYYAKKALTANAQNTSASRPGVPESLSSSVSMDSWSSDDSSACGSSPGTPAPIEARPTTTPSTSLPSRASLSTRTSQLDRSGTADPFILRPVQGDIWPASGAQDRASKHPNATPSVGARTQTGSAFTYRSEASGHAQHAPQAFLPRIESLDIAGRASQSAPNTEHPSFPGPLRPMAPPGLRRAYSAQSHVQHYDSRPESGSNAVGNANYHARTMPDHASSLPTMHQYHRRPSPASYPTAAVRSNALHNSRYGSPPA